MTVELRKLNPRVTNPGGKLTLAKPEMWTANVNCSTAPGQKWSDTNASEYDSDKITDERAAELCAGCPMIQECLEDALSWERTLSSRNRYGIRGGLTPAGRAQLEAKAEQRVCSNNHQLGEVGVYVGASGYERCKKCVAEYDSRRERKYKKKVA